MFSLILIKLEFSRQSFEKSSNTKFRENMSSRSWVVTWGRKAGWTDMMNLTVAFCNFTNAPNNW